VSASVLMGCGHVSFRPARERSPEARFSRPRVRGDGSVCRRVLVGLEAPAPPEQKRMDRGRADDGLTRHGQLHGMKNERLRLRSREPAVERDQLLERAPLLELGIVEAADHDVGDVSEGVRPTEVGGRVRRERRERVLALHPVVVEVSRPVGAEDDRAAVA
jgi:hypothetical protein